MIQRLFKPPEQNSYFLFGARGTGKTTLLRQLYSEEDSLFVDLLDLNLFDELIMDSGRFQAMIRVPEHRHKRVVVDEIQKLPRLLDVVHSEIQKTKRQFVLTGSSSRRLKQAGTDLLAGRAWVYQLYPLTSLELGEEFDLKRALERGSLPEAILAETDQAAREFLKAYVGTYLQREIQQEQWVRNLAPFRRFLAVAAQMNGKIVNKSRIARNVGVDDVTVANYFEILEDTLVGWMLPAFHESVRKSQRQSPKFYFIDTGVKRALERTLTVELLPQTSAWGDAFEHWVLLEIVRLASYRRLDWEFSYLRTKDDAEIDLIVARPGKRRLMLEIKSKSRVEEGDAKELETLGRDADPGADRWLVSNDPLDRTFGTTRAVSWRKALAEMFA